MTALPRFLQVVETSIYVDDLRAAERFYCDVLGLRRVGGHAGRGLFFAAGRNMLLAFYAPETLRGERVPPHGARGAGHFALEVERVSDLERWQAHLEQHGVAIERQIEWSTPELRSIYFRDPAGNSVEIIVRGVWPI